MLGSGQAPNCIKLRVLRWQFFYWPCTYVLRLTSKGTSVTLLILVPTVLRVRPGPAGVAEGVPRSTKYHLIAVTTTSNTGPAGIAGVVPLVPGTWYAIFPLYSRLTTNSTATTTTNTSTQTIDQLNVRSSSFFSRAAAV